MTKIQIKIIPKMLEPFTVPPMAWSLEVTIGSIRLISEKPYISEYEAIKRARYLADKWGVKWTSTDGAEKV